MLGENVPLLLNVDIVTSQVNILAKWYKNRDTEEVL